MSSTSLRASVVNGFFWLAASKAVGQAISWAVTLGVVRLLTPQDYGLMGMAVLVNSFLLLFNELGLGVAIIQRPKLTDRDLSDLRWVVFLVNLALGILVFAAAAPLAGYFREPSLVGILRVMALVFLVNGIGASSGFLLARRMQFRKKAEAELIGNVAGSLATLGTAVAGFGVWSLVAGVLLMNAATSAWYCLSAPIPVRWAFSPRNVLQSLHFGSQVALGKILWWVSASADSVIVGRMLGAVQLGYYGLAVQFASIPLQKVVSLITQVALPSFSALQHDDERLRRYYLRLVGMVAFLVFPMFVGMYLLAGDAVHVVLGKKWEPIIVPFGMLCLSSCLRAVETLNTPLLLARNRPGIPLFNSFLQAIVLPLAFYAGALWNGLNGVAFAWLVVWPFLLLLVTGQTLHVLGLPARAYFAAVGHPVAGVAVMTAVVLGVKGLTGSGGGSIATLAFTSVSGALAYLTYHALFDRDTLHDALSTLRIRKRQAPAAPPGIAGPADPVRAAHEPV